LFIFTIFQNQIDLKHSQRYCSFTKKITTTGWHAGT